MRSSKALAFCLLACQFTGLSAFADETDSSVSAEETLLIKAFELQGEGLSTADLLNAINASLSDYFAHASPDGQQERLEQALIDLRVYTPEQARFLIGDAQAGFDRLTAQASSENRSTLQSSVTTEIGRLVAVHPTGAQFSGCTALNTAAIVTFVGGAATLITGAILTGTGHGGVGDPMMTWGGVATGVGGVAVAIAFFVDLANMTGGC